MARILGPQSDEIATKFMPSGAGQPAIIDFTEADQGYISSEGLIATPISPMLQVMSLFI